MNKSKSRYSLDEKIAFLRHAENGGRLVVNSKACGKHFKSNPDRWDFEGLVYEIVQEPITMWIVKVTLSNVWAIWNGTNSDCNDPTKPCNLYHHSIKLMKETDDEAETE